jgi:hypothetical protein
VTISFAPEAEAAPQPESWHQANQRYLARALEEVRKALRAHAARAQGGEPTPIPDTFPPSEERTGPGPALETLCSRFQLSRFERSVVALCAGMELDGGFADLCAAAHGDPQRRYPTLGLALAALPDAHWNALTPAAPLRRWRLIDVAPGAAGAALTQGPLRLDERILHYLLGVSYLDERLATILEVVPPDDGLAPSHQALADGLLEAWARSAGAAPFVLLLGEDGESKREIAAAACRGAGLRLLSVAAGSLPTAAPELETFLRLWEREATLGGAALLLECEDLEATDAARALALRRLVGRLTGIVILTARERLQGLRRPLLTFDVEKPSPEEQRELWRRELGPAAECLNGQIGLLTTQFHLGLPAIRAAGVQAGGRILNEGTTDGDGGEEWGQRLWDACRTGARARLDELAQRINPAAEWDDLVLPEPQQRLLREIAGQVRSRMRVYEEWGFGRPGSRGLGVSGLFAGASGTGKTMAAEVLAGVLRLDLYRIDLSSVVSKYIGETEKNLRRVFDAAEEGGVILLFDEADALFGKRTEVKDSHDRYANIEVSYLLQRMESYRGLAILTTNMKSALDVAFLRRLRFVVQFPFPDAPQRAEIWRRAFPANAPTEGLDFERLARLSVAGGNIRNIALHAAFHAAEAGEPIRMAHLLRAARGEYAKLEKPLTDAEIAGWIG